MNKQSKNTFVTTKGTAESVIHLCPEHGSTMGSYSCPKCMNKTNLSSSTECKCCGHKIEDYDCPCFHEGWITGNSEPPLKEQEKWDTTTQGDELSGNPGKLGDNSTGCICLEDNKMTQALCPVHNKRDEQIQTKGVRNHPEKDRYKDQIADILANRYGLILLPAVDELAALFPVEGESEEKHLTGDDSVKEQIKQIVKSLTCYDWLDMPEKEGKMLEDKATNKALALFQSQESNQRNDPT